MLASVTLLGALCAVAALVSSSAVQAAPPPSPPSHVGGIVPTIGKQSLGSGNLVNHGGPVMATNKTYAIYWQPNGYAYGAGYTSTINQFFTDVAADSGKTTNVYAVATQYSSIQYSSSFGGSVTVTAPFPASGCPIYEQDITECLSDTQIQNEVNTVATAQGWAKNATNMFFVFTPKNVGSCFGSSASSGCAYTDYCAYHGYTGAGAIYANMPYGQHAGCDEGQYPNGDDADPTINVTSHEHNEAITDPHLNAWYDNAGYEIGDKCAWIFGGVSGSNGAEYNQTINGHHYFLQEEYSNSGSACLQTYSGSGGGGGGGAPKITSFSPTSGKRGSTVTITGSNLTGATWVGLFRTSFAYWKSPSWTVVSSTSITATIATNAATGYSHVRVTTPSGTATSTGYFNVTG
jgi:hypothetical protein